MITIPNGFLCALEGIDGSGKSSLVKAIQEPLSKKFSLIISKEPGGTWLGQQVRAIVQNPPASLSSRAEFLLFAADRAQHFDELVLPALQKGMLVLSDRMADSAIAYQGFGRGLSKDFIEQVNNWAMQNRKPDLTLYLQLDFQTAMRRIHKRSEKASIFDQEQEQFFKKVIHGFEQLYKNRTDVCFLDATLSPELLMHQALTCIQEAIAKKLRST